MAATTVGAMPAVHLVGVHRPALAPLLAMRGLRVVDRDGAAVAQLASEGGVRIMPTLVEAADAARAAALLDAGADDVVLRGDADVLVAARLAALVRRSAVMLRVGELAIDTVARTATRGDRALNLRPREFALLAHLARHAGSTVGRDALRRAILGLDFDPGTNAVEVHVSRLRAELDRGAAAMLATVRGSGYRLAVPAGRDA